MLNRKLTDMLICNIRMATKVRPQGWFLNRRMKKGREDLVASEFLFHKKWVIELLQRAPNKEFINLKAQNWRNEEHLEK